MKSFVIFNDDGTVARAGVGKYPPPDSYPFSPPLSPSALNTMMLVPRPQSPDPVWDADAQTITIPPVPEGTEITLSDQEGGEIMAEWVADADGWTEIIEITDPGSYACEIAVPLPFLPVEIKITVEGEASEPEEETDDDDLEEVTDP